MKSLTNVRLPGSELLENVDVSGNSFGLNKLAICTTKASKLYALDMLDGSVRWYVFSGKKYSLQDVALADVRAAT